VQPECRKILSRHHHAAPGAVDDLDNTVSRGNYDELHFHRLEHNNPFTRTNALAGFNGHLPHACRHGRSNRFAAIGQIGVIQRNILIRCIDKLGLS
jgi:hypothetical protein